MNNIEGIVIEENAFIFNTYKLESKAKYLVKVKTLDGLTSVLKYLKDNDIKYFIIGKGSNVILDEYFDGAVITIEMNEISINGEILTAEAGAIMSAITAASLKNGLVGLEWAINIPGTIGGSVVGNAGAYKNEIFDTLNSIKVLDGDVIKVINANDIDHSYRNTSLKSSNMIVLEATFKLERGNVNEAKEVIRDRFERRKATQPLECPSAGSVFRNPDGDFAGRLIEEAGLKGKIIGGAQVSEKHANFIVNIGGATSNDIKNLIKLIHDTVLEKFNVDLILEQEIIDWK